MDLAAQSNGKSKQAKKGNGKSARDAYYDKISKLDMAPLWVVLKDIIPDEPKTVCAPASGASGTSSRWSRKQAR